MQKRILPSVFCAISPYFDLDRGMDILVFTAAEWQARLDQGAPFAQTLMRESLRLIEPA